MSPYGFPYGVPAMFTRRDASNVPRVMRCNPVFRWKLWQFYANNDLQNL